MAQIQPPKDQGDSDQEADHHLDDLCEFIIIIIHYQLLFIFICIIIIIIIITNFQ